MEPTTMGEFNQLLRDLRLDIKRIATELQTGDPEEMFSIVSAQLMKCRHAGCAFDVAMGRMKNGESSLVVYVYVFPEAWTRSGERDQRAASVWGETPTRFQFTSRGLFEDGGATTIAKLMTFATMREAARALVQWVKRFGDEFPEAPAIEAPTGKN